MLHKSKYTHIAIAFMLACLLACNGGSSVWEDQKGIADARWPASDVLTYKMNVNDTVSYFNLLVDIRNRTDYPFSNLYLFISAQAPSGAMHADTMNYILANDNGEWTGRGSMSKFKNNRFPFRSNIRFPLKGEYLIKIQHGMRRDTLIGISNIGIRLEKLVNE